MKKMKMEYKKAMANDTGRIVSLVHHTIMTVYPQYYPEKVVDFFCGLHCEKNIRRDVEKGNVGVVYSGERLAGTGSFDGNHITRVYVAPEFQRQGYGSFIMEQRRRGSASIMMRLFWMPRFRQAQCTKGADIKH